MKKLFSVILVICLFVICLTACANVQTELESPTNVSIDDSILSWNSVEGATGYIIFVDGSEKGTTLTNSFDLSTLNLSAEKEYSVQVKAKGDGYVKLGSKLSASVIYKFTDDARRMLSNDEKFNYYNGNSNSYYGVGRTINVIDDEYLDVDSKYAKIFDENQLLSMDWRTSFTGKMDTISTQAFSMEEFYLGYNAQIGASMSVGGKYKIFSAGISNTFGFAANEQFKNVKNEIFYQSSQVHSSRMVEIDERLDTTKFSNALKSMVLTDARNLSPMKFFQKYGTHTILAAYYGGRIDCNYYLCNIGQKWDNETALNFANSMSVGISILQASSDLNFSIKNEIGCNNNETYSKFSVNTVGGISFKAINEKDFIENYGAWIDSFNEQELENTCIVGLPAKSMIAIWDLFPEEYNAERDKLEAYFNSHANSVSQEFLSKFAKTNVNPTYIANIRQDEIKVVDGNPISDVVVVPYSFNDLYNAGFSKIFIKISFMLKETGTCYQHISLLDGKKNFLIDKTFEQGGHTMKPYNKYERFEFDYEISLDELNKKYPNNLTFWLKYRASGNGWDANEFQIKNVSVSFVFS